MPLNTKNDGRPDFFMGLRQLHERRTGAAFAKPLGCSHTNDG